MTLARGLILTLLGALVSAVAAAFINGFYPYVLPNGAALVVMLWSLAGATVPAIACASARERGKAPRVMVSGIFACGVAVVAWTTYALFAPAMGRFDAVMALAGAVTPTAYAVAVAWTGLILLPRPRAPRMRWVQRLTIVIAILTVGYAASMVVWVMYVDWMHGSWRAEVMLENAIRRGAAMGLVAVGGMVALATGVGLPRILGETDGAVGEFTFGVTCPRCGRKAMLRTGGDRCPRCRLLITVRPT